MNVALTHNTNLLEEDYGKAPNCCPVVTIHSRHNELTPTLPSLYDSAFRISQCVLLYKYLRKTFRKVSLQKLAQPARDD